MTDIVALRAALSRAPKHLLWKLVDRFQRNASEMNPNDEYVRWADITAILSDDDPIDILRAIIYASDGCQGHRGCNHSMEPWQRARRLLTAIDGEPDERP